MGILNNRQFEGYTGKIGGTVAYKLMGKEVLRIIGKTNKPPTVNQLANRMKMALIIEFLKPITEFINIGFGVNAAKAGMYPHNLAVSFNKKHALKGNYPNIAINYSKVLVAAGNLLPAQNAAVEQITEGLNFTWNAAIAMEWPEREDLTLLLVYFPSLKKAVYIMGTAKRYWGTAVMPIDPVYANQYMETYISFVSIDNKAAANSVYTGALNAP
ncbi:hypothetical protein HDC92_001557 [Pedobacter sp. AK017]|uniref:DUF6266 family protein n=1 Tax=Pedobacter sp. AK017 TaxID=2723073 RepID=UPI001616BEE1|nr:DUF6266 family protein [Pedobacter sp. AK017]MBB5437883.1 hypothetical protein [Pedobacter sp. AK017]